MPFCMSPGTVTPHLVPRPAPSGQAIWSSADAVTICVDALLINCQPGELSLTTKRVLVGVSTATASSCNGPLDMLSIFIVKMSTSPSETNCLFTLSDSRITDSGPGRLPLGVVGSTSGVGMPGGVGDGVSGIVPPGVMVGGMVPPGVLVAGMVPFGVDVASGNVPFGVEGSVPSGVAGNVLFCNVLFCNVLL